MIYKYFTQAIAIAVMALIVCLALLMFGFVVRMVAEGLLLGWTGLGYWP